VTNLVIGQNYRLVDTGRAYGDHIDPEFVVGDIVTVLRSEPDGDGEVYVQNLGGSETSYALPSCLAPIEPEPTSTTEPAPVAVAEREPTLAEKFSLPEPGDLPVDYALAVVQHFQNFAVRALG